MLIEDPSEVELNIDTEELEAFALVAVVPAPKVTVTAGSVTNTVSTTVVGT